MSTERTADVTRNTAETQIRVRLNLDGTGTGKFASGIGFLDHMLDQIARHGLIDLDIACQGDLHIDGHHTVEDIGITLGQAMAKAVGDKKVLRRYGHAYVPLDEALSRVVIDFSGRPGLEYHVKFTQIYLSKPTTSDANDETQSLFPKEARLRNLTCVLCLHGPASRGTQALTRCNACGHVAAPQLLL